MIRRNSSIVMVNLSIMMMTMPTMVMLITTVLLCGIHPTSFVLAVDGNDMVHTDNDNYQQQQRQSHQEESPPNQMIRQHNDQQQRKLKRQSSSYLRDTDEDLRGNHHNGHHNHHGHGHPSNLGEDNDNDIGGRNYEVLFDPKAHICRDSHHFGCDIVMKNNGCDTPSKLDPNALIGDVYCRASCGRCFDTDNDDPDNSSSSGRRISSVIPSFTCYTFGRQQIDLSFTNIEPEREDWIGIYPSDNNKNNFDPTDLGSPTSWYWLCNSNKRDRCKATMGIATVPWLPPGSYVAVLSRNSKGGKGPYEAFGPFEAYAFSEPFEVVRGGGACAQ